VASAHVVMNMERWIVLLIGLAVSFIVALGVVEWFLYWVRKHGFTMFAIYRIVLGGFCCCGEQNSSGLILKGLRQGWGIAGGFSHIRMCGILHIEGVAMPTNLAIDDRLIDEGAPNREARHKEGSCDRGFSTNTSAAASSSRS